MASRGQRFRWLSGEPQFGFGSRGHFDFAAQRFAADLPAAGDAALRGVEFALRGGQAATGFGGEEDLFVAGSQPTDAADDGIHPLAHRAVGVVVEGIHADVAEAVLFGVAVPTLPHGRRAVAHGVEPGRIVLLQENLVGQIGAAEASKHGQQQGCADEAGRQMTIARFDQIDEMREGFRSELGR